MKGMRLYAVLVLVLIAAGAVWVPLSQRAGTAGPLRMLGKSEREYRHARKLLLLNTHDATPALLKFCADKRKSVRARVEALRILQDVTFHAPPTGAAPAVAALLAEPTTAIQLEALKALEQLRSLQGTPDMLRIFHEAQDTALSEQCRRTMLKAAVPLRRSLEKSLAAGDSAVSDSFVAALESIPFGRCATYKLLADHYRGAGDMSKASEYQRKAGAVNIWWTAGRFSSLKMVGYGRDYGPESRPFSSGDAFDDGGERRSWSRLTRGVDWGHVDNGPVFGWEGDDFAAYYFVYLHAPDRRRAMLMFSWDDAGKAWLNDSLVLLRECSRGEYEDDAVVKVDFVPGVNRLLVKLVQGMGQWGMYCRVADTTGAAMSDVVISLEEELSDAHLGPVLDCFMSRADSLCRQSDVLDPTDDRLVEAVAAAATDESMVPMRRAAAVRLLAMLNRARAVPSGERELLASAVQLPLGDVSGLLCSMAEALAEMGSSRGIDLGLSLRGSTVAVNREAGEKLVSVFCRSRLGVFPDITKPDRRFEISRTVHEVEALQPTAADVLKTIARFHAADKKAPGE